MHTMVFVDWAREAESAQVKRESANSDRLMERQKTEPNKQRSERNRQSDENNDFKVQLEVQKAGCLMQNGVG